MRPVDASLARSCAASTITSVSAYLAVLGIHVRYGCLGLEGDALVEDVLAGDFRIHWLDHDDITTKIWASRCDAAFRAGATARSCPCWSARLRMEATDSG